MATATQDRFAGEAKTKILEFNGADKTDNMLLLQTLFCV